MADRGRPADFEADAMVLAYSCGQAKAQWSQGQEAGLRPYERLLFDHCLSDHGARICTVGCGAGRETFALYKLGYRNVVGVDPAEPLLELARQKCRTEGLGIPFHLAKADRLPFEDACFDAITLFENVLGHITPRSARQRSLAEMARVLRPGGLVMLKVNSRLQIWRYHLALLAMELSRVFYNPHGLEKGDKRFGVARGDKLAPGMKPAVTHFFMPGEVPQDATRLGLSVVRKSTEVGIVKSPQTDSTKLHGQRDLIYVLKKNST